MAKNFSRTLKAIERQRIGSLQSFKVVRLRHVWTISDFYRHYNRNKVLESYPFSSQTNNSELQWCLELYPNGYKGYTDEDIRLDLTLVNSNKKEIEAEVTLGLVNAEGKDVHFVSALDKFTKGDSWGIEKCLNKDSLFKEENKYLSNGKLTIFCEIADAKVGKNNISGTLTTPQFYLLKDFTFMFENREWCDVTLSVGGKEFPAHKAILAARSPVFRVMFQNDMEESRTNRVDIADLDEEDLNEMLRYMYTGEVHKLDEMAPRLLGMAEKYAMDGLKMKCEKALVENLSPENAAETFILSDTFRTTKLKNWVKKFIVAHAEDVGKTSGFQSMVKTHPHLGIEAFCALSNPFII